MAETAEAGQAAAIFTAVFVIIWVGSAIVTVNTLLLGGKVFVLFFNIDNEYYNLVNDKEGTIIINNEINQSINERINE